MCKKCIGQGKKLTYNGDGTNDNLYLFFYSQKHLVGAMLILLSLVFPAKSLPHHNAYHHEPLFASAKLESSDQDEHAIVRVVVTSSVSSSSSVSSTSSFRNNSDSSSKIDDNTNNNSKKPGVDYQETNFDEFSTSTTPYSSSTESSVEDIFSAFYKAFSDQKTPIAESQQSISSTISPAEVSFSNRKRNIDDSTKFGTPSPWSVSNRIFSKPPIELLDVSGRSRSSVIQPSPLTSERKSLHGDHNQRYDQTTEKSWGQPEKVWGEPEQVWGEPAKVWGEPAKVWGVPEKNWYPSTTEPIISTTRLTSTTTYGAQIPSRGADSRGIPMAGVNSNIVNLRKRRRPKIRRIGTADPSDGLFLPQVMNANSGSDNKFGYVLEGADVRRYRVEERTPDGFIVGEYGVLNHDNRFLRGVRYTADGTINPSVIHDALMKFLAL